MRLVCVKCLHLSGREKVTPIRRHGRNWWACADETACESRRAVNRRRHAREINRRLRDDKHTHLIVVLDRLGAEFGYGNLYYGVSPGECPVEKAGKILADSREGENMLVVEAIVPAGGDYKHTGSDKCTT